MLPEGCVHTDQMPPLSSRIPRIVATSFTRLGFIVAIIELLPHFYLELIGHTLQRALLVASHAMSNMVLYSGNLILREKTF